MKSKQKIVVIPGFLENSLHANKLRKSLEKHGFSVRVDMSLTPKIEKDEVVLSHSGGTWLLGTLDNKVFAAATPFLTDHKLTSWALALINKEKLQYKSYKKSDWLLMKGKSLSSILKFWRNNKIAKLVNKPLTVQAYHLLPANDVLRHKNHNYFGSMVGILHDDLYIHPDKYVEEIIKLLQK